MLGSPLTELESICRAILDVHEFMQDYRPSVPGPGSIADTLLYHTKKLNSVDSLLDRLERGAKGLRRIRVEVIVSRNMSLPIHRLPPELLLSIFLLCVDINPCSAFTLSHTCSLWRSISLAHPTMWNQLDLSGLSHALFRLILSRIGTLPLRVVDCNSSAKRDIIQQVLGQRHRLEELRMQIDRGNGTAAIVADISQALDFPVLRNLTLESVTQRRLRFLEPETNPILRTPLLGGLTPQLSHLTLIGCRMPFCRGNYFNLSVLNIIGDLPRAGVDDDICWVLRESPNLEDLNLELYAPHSEGRNPVFGDAGLDAGPMHTPLRRLKNLQLKMPLPLIMRLMLSISSDSIECLVLDVNTSLETHDLKLSTLFESSFGGCKAPRVFQAIQHLSVDVNIALHQAHRGSTDHHSIQLSGMRVTESGQSSTILYLHWTDCASGAQAMLPDVAQAVRTHHAMPRLESVKLSSDDTNRGACASWEGMYIFAYLTHYRHLSLVNTGHRAITSWSRLPPRALPRLVPIAFPHVVELTIEGDVHYDDMWRIWEWRRDLPRLASLDMGRAIMQCDVQHQGFALMRQIALHRTVADIIWPQIQFYDHASHEYKPRDDISGEWLQMANTARRGVIYGTQRRIVGNAMVYSAY